MKGVTGVMIHVYLDDMRPCPRGFTSANNAEQCILLLQEFEIQVLSLDHDLGWNQKNGDEVVSWMIRHKKFAKEIYLHSSSLPARKRMYEMLIIAKPEDVQLYQTPVSESRIKQIAQETHT
jgi:hypothetical protein